MKKLPVSFYRSENVLQIAKELLGKVLVTKYPPAFPSQTAVGQSLWRQTKLPRSKAGWAGEGIVTSGRIVEVEAYNGVIDKASHAAGGRRTKRNEIMYGGGGVAYVYLCYGIHHLFNVVTNKPGTPHAILIRALEPVKGIDTMLKRVGKKELDYSLTRGPGNLSKALGIFTEHSGISLRSKELFIADDGFAFPEKQMASSQRIGVDYAGKDAKLPYRFYIKGNPYVSSQPR